MTWNVTFKEKKLKKYWHCYVKNFKVKKLCLPGPSAYEPVAVGRALQPLLTQHGAACQGAFTDIPGHQIPTSVANKAAPLSLWRGWRMH